MSTAIIVEDEYLAREELSYFIQKYSQLEVLHHFEDGLDAFKYLQSAQVDVVFLDINIPSIDGVMLAKNLHQMQNPPQIIFTTAYKEHAAEAYEIEAFDYLLKPLNEQRVIRTLEKLSAQLTPTHVEEVKSEPTQDHLALNHGANIRIIDKNDILYAHAQEKLTYVYAMAENQVIELIAHYSISELCTKLPESQFYRSHRSYCVNLSKISQIKPGLNSTYLLNLTGSDVEVPVSRANIKAFRQIMGL